MRNNTMDWFGLREHYSSTVRMLQDFYEVSEIPDDEATRSLSYQASVFIEICEDLQESNGKNISLLLKNWEPECAWETDWLSHLFSLVLACSIRLIRGNKDDSETILEIVRNLKERQTEVEKKYLLHVKEQYKKVVTIALVALYHTMRTLELVVTHNTVPSEDLVLLFNHMDSMVYIWPKKELGGVEFLSSIRMLVLDTALKNKELSNQLEKGVESYMDWNYE